MVLVCSRFDFHYIVITILGAMTYAFAIANLPWSQPAAPDTRSNPNA
jgi:hypothetical protein